jgi:hypothetical protein
VFTDVRPVGYSGQTVHHRPGHHSLVAVTVAVKTSALSERPGLVGSFVRAQDRRTWSVTKPRVVLHSFTLFVRLVSPARPLPFDYFLMIAAYAESKAAVKWPASERY